MAKMTGNSHSPLHIKFDHQASSSISSSASSTTCTSFFSNLAARAKNVMFSAKFDAEMITLIQLNVSLF